MCVCACVRASRKKSYRERERPRGGECRTSSQIQIPVNEQNPWISSATERLNEKVSMQEILSSSWDIALPIDRKENTIVMNKSALHYASSYHSNLLTQTHERCLLRMQRDWPVCNARFLEGKSKLSFHSGRTRLQTVCYCAHIMNMGV